MTKPFRRKWPELRTYHQVLASHELGGAGLNALRTAEEISSQGGLARVWIPGDGPASALAGSLGLSTSFYDGQGALSGWPGRAVKANLAFCRGLRRAGPGIVHVHSPFHYGALWRGLAFSGLKRVVHVQIQHDRDGLSWVFRRPPELIITCAEYLVDYVRSALPPQFRDRENIVALPNAADTERFVPGDKKRTKLDLGFPCETPLLLMLANLAAHKGQETAIRALEVLRGRGIKCLLVLAGTERGGCGEYTAKLHALVRELHLEDQVRLVGFRNDSERLLQAADFLLLPSTQEGLPLAIVEAQATQVPVLAAPTAGIPEVIKDGETGFLIRANDFVGYANRIQGLLSDPGMREHITERAYQQALTKYSWQAYFQRLCCAYDEVLFDAPTRAVR